MGLFGFQGAFYPKTTDYSWVVIQAAVSTEHHEYQNMNELCLKY